MITISIKDFKEVKEWLNNIEFQRTKTAYSRGLKLFCDYFEMTPIEVLNNDPKMNNDLLDDVIDHYAKQNTEYQIISAGVKSFLKYHGKYEPKEYTHEWLISFELVNKWANQKNKKTRKGYLRKLKIFCDYFKITPKDILSNDSKTNGELLNEICRYYDENKKRGKNLLKSAINSFLRFYNKKYENNNEGRDQYGRFKGSSKRKYDWLLEYECVNRWIKRKKSQKSRENNLYMLNQFLTVFDLTPDELLHKVNTDKVEVKKLIKRMREDFEDAEKYSRAKQLNQVLKSFIDYHDDNETINFKYRDTEKIKVPRKRMDDEYIPKKDEIYLMADNCTSLRNKAIILVAFQSGIRKNAIIKLPYDMVKDFLFPELKTPIRLKITSKIDTKVSEYNLGYYWAFIGYEGALALKNYLEYRIRNGWNPKDEDILFISEGKIKDKIRPMGEADINDFLKKVAKKLNICDPKNIHIHNLRHSFRHQFYGHTNDQIAEILMGHILEGSQDYYALKKDVNRLEKEYQKVPFGRESKGRINGLEAKLKEKDEEINELREQYESLTNLIKEYGIIADNEKDLDNFEEMVIKKTIKAIESKFDLIPKNKKK